MTRLDCLAWCARYYQYYEYAILSEILPTLPDAENNTTGLSCLIKNPVKRQNYNSFFSSRVLGLGAF